MSFSSTGTLHPHRNLFWLYPIFGQNQGLHKKGIDFPGFLCKAAGEAGVAVGNASPEEPPLSAQDRNVTRRAK
jgi:hypothetical protein